MPVEHTARTYLKRRFDQYKAEIQKGLRTGDPDRMRVAVYHGESSSEVNLTDVQVDFILVEERGEQAMVMLDKIVGISFGTSPLLEEPTVDPMVAE